MSRRTLKVMSEGIETTARPRKVRDPGGDPHLINRLRKNEPIALKVGARVMYTAAFCRMLGFTGGDRRGTVTEAQSWQGPGYVSVRWDDEPSESLSISSTALCRAGELSPRACEAS